MKKKIWLVNLIFNFFCLFAAEPEYLTVLQNGQYVDKWLVNTDLKFYSCPEEKKYNKAGLIIYEKSDNGDEKFYYYDKENKLLKSEDETDVYDYDKNGFLIHSINKKTNFEKWYTNDKYGNTTSMKTSDGKEYKYDIKTNSKGKLISYETDKIQRYNQYFEDDVTLKYQKFVYLLSSSTRTTEKYFDKKGNEIRSIISSGSFRSETFTEYDSNNRVVKEIMDSITNLYEYDSKGLCTTVTEIFNGQKTIYKNTYDENNILTSKSMIFNGPFGLSTIDFFYDRNGNEIKVIHVDAPGLNEYYKYDEKNNLVWSKIEGEETKYTNELDENGLAVHTITSSGDEFWYTYEIKPNGFIYCKKTYKEY